MQQNWEAIEDRISSQIYHEAEISDYEAEQIKRKLIQEWNREVWEPGSSRLRLSEQTSDMEG